MDEEKKQRIASILEAAAKKVAGRVKEFVETDPSDFNRTNTNESLSEENEEDILASLRKMSKDLKVSTEEIKRKNAERRQNIENERNALNQENNRKLSINKKPEQEPVIHEHENKFNLKDPNFKKKIRELGKNIKTVIFGQDNTIDEVIDIFKTSLAGLTPNKKKPRGAFMFAGPSGCGKTETVMQMANLMGVPEMKFSMAEYSEENDVKKLIGAPPGYAGYENGGQLTNFVNDNPYSIVILDEIEKAHESLSKILLGVLDDGQLTDGKGMQVSFRNTIFVATTNLGAEAEYIKGMSEEEKKVYRMDAIKGFFRPEVLNRFDSINQFKAISKDIYKKIVNKVISNLEKDFYQEHGIHFDVAAHVIDFVADNSYDPAMGGRPAGRFISKVLVKGIVDKIFEDSALNNVKHIVLDLNEKGNIVFLNKTVLDKYEGSPKSKSKFAIMKEATLTEVENTKELLARFNEGRMSNEEEEVVERAKSLNLDTSKIENLRKKPTKSVKPILKK